MLSEKGHQAVEVAERHADRLASYAELEAANLRHAECDDDGCLAVYFAAGHNRSLRGVMESVFAYSTWAVRDRFAGEAGCDTLLGTASCDQSVAQSGLVREVFRNPFRPSSPLLPAVLAWKDSMVRRLAKAIYEERHLPAGTLDNGRLAILADALKEAGCTNPDVLSHCRQQGAVHVRGCWVIDAVLGKE
jgi:hypothetical protein